MSDLAHLFEDPEIRAKFDLIQDPIYKAAWAWRAKWLSRSHIHQKLPPGEWWSIFLMLAGRGAGKTRMAAEQIGWWAWENPNTRWLVAAPTSSDVRGTCFEGDSGLIAVIPKILVEDYNKTAHEIKLVNGSLIKGIPASEPERFRGPQFHGGWCDELAAWDYLQEAWDQIQFGVRLGAKTRIIWIGNPRGRFTVGQYSSGIGVIESLLNLVPEVQRYGSATAFMVAIVAVLWQQRHGIGLSRDNSHLE
jgi:phage terminase large subunit-like protein